MKSVSSTSATWVVHALGKSPKTVGRLPRNRRASALMDLPGLLIRADSTPQIGTGHVMRCLALAHAWREAGGTVVFAVHSPSEVLLGRIEAAGFAAIPVSRPHPEPGDLAFTRDLLRGPLRARKALAWVALDGYHFDGTYQRALRDEGYGILVIDDMAHLPAYHATVIVNQNIDASSLTYRHDGATLLLGTRYVMLRPEFLSRRAGVVGCRRKVRRLLVTMGGGDPENATLKVARALRVLQAPQTEIVFVVGSQYSKVMELENVVASLGSRALVLKDVRDMAAVMNTVDLAITAAGTTTWELAFMGIPMLVMVTAENQRGLAEGLERAGAALNLGASQRVTCSDIVRAVDLLISSPETRMALQKKARALVDGLGAARIVAALRDLSRSFDDLTYG